jgi:hypothetical protein
LNKNVISGLEKAHGCGISFLENKHIVFITGSRLHAFFITVFKWNRKNNLKIIKKTLCMFFKIFHCFSGGANDEPL